MTSHTGRGKSPNRLHAAVHALHHLMIDKSAEEQEAFFSAI